MARLWSAAVAAALGIAFSASRIGVAGELSESAADPSAFATRIDARRFDDRFATVQDVLEATPGVRVRRYGGLGAYSTASIRGAKAEQVVVLLDGVRLNSATRGAFDLSTLPLRQVETIEVIRGGGAARYGSDAVGGVIAITSRKPESAELAADGALLGGTHDTWGGDALVSGGGERALGLASYSRLSSGNEFRFEYDPPDRSGRGGGAASASEHTRLNADFAEDAGLLRGSLATGRRSRLDATLDLYQKEGGQPGSVWDRGTVDVADDVLSCTTSDERHARALGRLAWAHERALGGALELGAGLRVESSRFDDPAGACLLIPPWVAGRDYAKWREQESQADARWQAEPLELAAGVELAGRASAALRYATADASDAGVHRRTTLLVSAQPELSLYDGTLRLFPALAVETADSSEGLARSSASQGFEPVDPRDETAWLPAVGAILELAPGLRAKANWKRVLRRPGFTELYQPDWGFLRGNPSLESERGWNADVGLELTAPGGGALRELHAELVLFQRELDEGIEWLLNVNNAYMPLNTGPSRALGVEVALAGRLFERLALDASYTWTDARFLGGGSTAAALQRSNEKLFPHVPEHALGARAALALGPVEPWVDVRYESEVAFQVGSSTRADAALQLDAGVVIRLPRGLALSLEASNLNHEQRFDSLGQPLSRQTLWLVRVRGATP